MEKNDYVTILIVMFIFVILFVITNKIDSLNKQNIYAYDLFNTNKVHEINIDISEDDLLELLENPLAKTKYEVDITIDGLKVEDVSFSTKGNSSLFYTSKNKKSNRYNFKINFGKFVQNQTFYDLDKLHLNSCYADPTFMKDFLSYQIFNEIGVKAPLTSYVWLTINGINHGLYLAIEDISDSFMERNDMIGNLYKPENESSNIVGDNKNNINNNKNIFVDEETGLLIKELTDDFGASLIYTDDDFESYTDIFNNAENKINDDDKIRVITALKKLSKNEELDSYLETDEIIKYFAVHNFIMSYDSYTGAMLHNYYLYEEDGKISIFPWDYNEGFASFGALGLSGRDASSIINQGIDVPILGGLVNQRPLWEFIINNEIYLNKYHLEMENIIKEYFESNKYVREINRIKRTISPYVKKDSSLQFDYERFELAVDTLKKFCKKRTESVKLQLNGVLSTSSIEQDKELRIDASDIKIKNMVFK